MAIYKWFEIVCDGCGSAEGGCLPTVKQARDSAKECGWKVGLKGGRDLCAGCQPLAGGSDD